MLNDSSISLTKIWRPVQHCLTTHKSLVNNISTPFQSKISIPNNSTVYAIIRMLALNSCVSWGVSNIVTLSSLIILRHRLNFRPSSHQPYFNIHRDFTTGQTSDDITLLNIGLMACLEPHWLHCNIGISLDMTCLDQVWWTTLQHLIWRFNMLASFYALLQSTNKFIITELLFWFYSCTFFEICHGR